MVILKNNQNIINYNNIKKWKGKKVYRKKNETVGLFIIRTSIDYEVAFGKAGEGRANEESMREAIKRQSFMVLPVERCSTAGTRRRV